MENPKIEWCNVKNKNCLKFTFVNVLDVKHAEEGIKRWKEEFLSRQGEKIIVVWDCVDMDSYDPKARYLWQSALKELKYQIDSIWLITHSKLIKAGVKVISAVTSYKINVVSSETEINI